MRKILLGTAIVAGFAMFVNECAGRFLTKPVKNESEASSKTINSNNAVQQYGFNTTSTQMPNYSTYSPSVNPHTQNLKPMYTNTGYTSNTQLGQNATQNMAQTPVNGTLNSTTTNYQGFNGVTGGANVNGNTGQTLSGLTSSSRQKKEWKMEMDKAYPQREILQKNLKSTLNNVKKSLKNLKKYTDKLNEDLVKVTSGRVGGYEGLAVACTFLQSVETIYKNFEYVVKMIGYISGRCSTEDFDKANGYIFATPNIINRFAVSLYNTIYWVQNLNELKTQNAKQINDLGSTLTGLLNGVNQVVAQLNTVPATLYNDNSSSAVRAAKAINQIKKILEKITKMCTLTSGIISGQNLNGQTPTLLPDNVEI